MLRYVTMLNVYSHCVNTLQIKSFSLAVEVKSELAADKDTYNNNNYVPKCPYCAHLAVSCTHKHRLMLVIKLRVYCAQLLFTTVFLFLSAVVSIRARPDHVRTTDLPTRVLVHIGHLFALLSLFIRIINIYCM